MIDKIIIDSIMNMRPAPDPGHIYIGDDGINVLWFFPTPIFINDLDELQKFDNNVTRFLETNPMVEGAFSMSYQDEDMGDREQRGYDFYHNLGIRLIVEPMSQREQKATINQIYQFGRDRFFRYLVSIDAC